MEPNDLSLSRRLDFVSSALPAAPARVLDAGCGTGELAEALAKLGYAVTGLDVDPDSVGEAERHGRPVVRGDFLTHSAAEPYDAIVFSMSLHHMDPLKGAVDRAARLLAPGGRVILNEFAIEDAGESTRAWLDELLTVLDAAGVFAPSDLPLLGPVERWAAEEPPIARGQQMLDALSGRFTALTTVRGPSLYGYVCDRLIADARGHEIAARVLDAECAAIGRGHIAPLNLRVTATN